MVMNANQIISRIKVLRSKRFNLSTKKGISDMKANSKRISILKTKLLNLTYKK